MVEGAIAKEVTTRMTKAKLTCRQRVNGYPVYFIMIYLQKASFSRDLAQLIRP